MWAVENCEYHAFSVRDVALLLDVSTGASYAIDDATTAALRGAHAGVSPEGVARTAPDQVASALRELSSALAPRGEPLVGPPALSSDHPAYVSIHASQFCDMACRYCQAGGYRRTSSQPWMEVDTALRAMDFAVDEFAPEAPRITFGFSLSGEPLLAWELFEQIHAYGSELARRSGKQISWGINTNGLGLDDAMVAELGHVHAIAVQPQMVGIAKLARIGALLAPDGQQFRFAARSVEHLNPVVTGVGDPQMVMLVDRQILRPRELARPLAMPAPLKQELSLG